MRLRGSAVSAGALALLLTACAERPSAVGRAAEPPPAPAPTPAGPSVDATAKTPLHEAAENGDLQAVKELLRNGADIDAWALPDGTALIGALDNGHEDVALVLLYAGTKLTGDELQLAAREGMMEMLSTLIQRGVDVNAETKFGSTALHTAAKFDQVDAIKVLVKAGASVDKADDDGFTPLHMAAAEGKVEAVRALLDAGAKLEAKTSSGMTVLHWAIFSNAPTRIEIYPISSTDAPYATSKVQEQAPLVELLLARGARIDTKDGEGNTPLHQAVLMTSPASIKALLRRGASRTVKNDDGETPLDIAVRRGDDDFIPLLKK